jgi:hypothetical protein
MVKIATVETLESLLTAGDGVELYVDVALGVGIDGDVNDLAVFLIALGLNLNLQVLDPAVAKVLLFPRSC